MSEDVILAGLQDAYEIVEEALRRWPAARNDDDFLIWSVKKYLVSEGDLSQFENFKAGPSASTLLRRRQEIQNDEERYPPTKPDVAARRKVRAEIIKEYYADDPDIFQRFKASDKYGTIGPDGVE